MADSKLKKGKQDRAKVSRIQKYEVEHVARKFSVKPKIVRDAIKKVGNSRRKVYAELRASQ